MEVPAGPEWVEEHLKRLTANGIQPHFQLAHSAQLETVERLVRRGVYTGPLNLTWVSIGGGFDGPNPYTMMEFIRRVPDGASLTLESIMRNVLPINTMAIAMGLHPRCGNEDTLWGQLGEKLHLGRRRPPAGPDRRRARPRGRHRQGSPRHLQARRVLGQRRRGAGQARLPAQPQARPAGLPAPRLIAPIAASPTSPQVRARVPPGPHLRHPVDSEPRVRGRPPRSPVTGRAPDIDIESRTGASSWHRWSPRAGSTTPPSIHPAPHEEGPPALPVGRLRPHLRLCSCRTTCPGRSCPPSSPSSSWNGR